MGRSILAHTMTNFATYSALETPGRPLDFVRGTPIPWTGSIMTIALVYPPPTRGQFRGRLLMFFARSFKVLGIRFWQTFNSQSTLMVDFYPKISVFHMGICREWCHI